MLAQVQCVIVLNDAADLNVGERESLGHILEPLRLHDRLFKGLAFEVGDGAIRPYGSRLDIYNVISIFFEKWDLNVRIFPPLFGQNLDSDVVVLMGRKAGIIAIDLAK